MTTVDGVKLAHTLATVLPTYQHKLNIFLQRDALKKFANALHSSDVITDDLRDNPVYADIQQQFTVYLECLEEKQEFEDTCKVFVTALATAGGGPLKRVAGQIQNEWKLTVKTELHIDLDL